METLTRMLKSTPPVGALGFLASGTCPGRNMTSSPGPTIGKFSMGNSGEAMWETLKDVKIPGFILFGGAFSRKNHYLCQTRQ